jgi:hypothetical protein
LQHHSNIIPLFITILECTEVKGEVEVEVEVEVEAEAEAEVEGQDKVN